MTNVRGDEGSKGVQLRKSQPDSGLRRNDGDSAIALTT